MRRKGLRVSDPIGKILMLLIIKLSNYKFSNVLFIFLRFNQSEFERHGWHD